MRTFNTQEFPIEFSGFPVTSIDITEDEEGIVHKIQLHCDQGPLASALIKPSYRNNLQIKDYSENEGLLDVLVAGKIVEINDLGICKLLA